MSARLDVTDPTLATLLIRLSQLAVDAAQQSENDHRATPFSLTIKSSYLCCLT